MTIRWKPRKTWREKLEKDQQPKVVDTPPRMQKAFGARKMLIPTPALVDALMKKAAGGETRHRESDQGAAGSGFQH